MRDLVELFFIELQNADPSGMYDVSGEEVAFDCYLSKHELETVLRRVAGAVR